MNGDIICTGIFFRKNINELVMFHTKSFLYNTKPLTKKNNGIRNCAM